MLSAYILTYISFYNLTTKNKSNTTPPPLTIRTNGPMAIFKRVQKATTTTTTTTTTTRTTTRTTTTTATTTTTTTATTTTTTTTATPKRLPPDATFEKKPSFIKRCVSLPPWNLRPRWIWSISCWPWRRGVFEKATRWWSRWSRGPGPRKILTSFKENLGETKTKRDFLLSQDLLMIFFVGCIWGVYIYIFLYSEYKFQFELSLL